MKNVGLVVSVVTIGLCAWAVYGQQFDEAIFWLLVSNISGPKVYGAFKA